MIVNADIDGAASFPTIIVEHPTSVSTTRRLGAIKYAHKIISYTTYGIER